MTAPGEMTCAEIDVLAIAGAVAKAKDAFIRAFAAYVRAVIERETDPTEKIALFVHSMVEGQRERIAELMHWRDEGPA